MRTENYYNTRYEAVLTYAAFELLCAAILNGHMDLTYRNPDVGLSVSNFDGWQTFFENDELDAVPIECSYRCMQLMRKDDRGNWDNCVARCEEKRVKFLEAFGFKRLS